MSYAIIRNEKLTRAESYGAYVHNDRKAKNHSNKDIDPTRTHLNFYCKENETTYIREFDRMKKEYNLQGNLRKNSIVMCQMMITSDNEFFKKINLIIVKDLSRFGRLSSKISYYLEEFFIEKGVRFIAVTDDIDTGHIETSEEMVQFKAFFNEWFLRDTSRKVRNGKKTRAKEGKVMTTYPTYRL